MKNKKKLLTIVTFAFVLLLIVFLILTPADFFKIKKDEFKEDRLLTAPATYSNKPDTNMDRSQAAFEVAQKPRIDLDEGEVIVTVLNDSFDGDTSEEQVIAYRNLKAANTPVYITFVDYDAAQKKYNRLWSAATEITQTATISLYSEDLVGDRSKCIIVTGMNSASERIMDVYRNIDIAESANGNAASSTNNMKKIASIKIDGTISLVETERTQAYHLGMTTGASYKISVHGRDTASSNPMDQIEIIYSYNPERNYYEQSSVKHIPGLHIETRKLRDLLNGNAKEFEEFIEGLWYHINYDGTVDNDRYVYFDINDREVVFYDEDTQQVYNWIGSTSTRYGLYISSQNISVATLRRIMDIELESLESIRIKVFEDVHMKILIDAPWDGSYKKAKYVIKSGNKKTAKVVQAFLNASYLSSIGSVQFFDTGIYILTSAGRTKKGKYIFFALDDNEYLELLPESEAFQDTKQNAPKDWQAASRETYQVVRSESKPDDFSLQRIKFTISGLQEFHESVLVFTKEK